ncbi:MAG: TRAP transporter small permease [Gudongella sp.]|jgi:TRAP-type C4-dicarboxylate transport system permease small subunit|nr:TRAP transporter small permease [Gudongella sp.]
MSAIKWIDEHLEESILIILLAMISIVMMAQIIARTFTASMIWPEEFSRYCYVWTVFLSLGYTIKKGNMLRVGILMDMLPLTLRRLIELLTNTIMLVLFAVLFKYAIIYTGKIKITGQFSPAMHIPMWIMYLSTIIGFGLATIRMLQEIFKNIRYFGAEAETTLEATLKEAQEEVIATGTEIKHDLYQQGGES